MTDPTPDGAKRTHSLDQGLAAIRVLGAMVAILWTELLANGVSRADALLIVGEYIRGTINPPADRDEE